MNGWQGYITVGMQRRRAMVEVSKHAANYNKIEPGKHACYVLGIFQCADGGDIAPYALCELQSGQVIYADPKEVWFVDTDEFGNIIDETEAHD